MTQEGRPTSRGDVLEAIKAFREPALELAEAFEPGFGPIVIGFRQDATELPDLPGRGRIPLSGHGKFDIMARYAGVGKGPMVSLATRK